MRTALALAPIFLAALAGAQVWDESVDGQADAGELAFSAQPCEGAGPLTSIQGSLTAGTDVDAFVFRITDAAAFSATTMGGAIWDTQLFLFTEFGEGVVANDDTPGSNGRSTISSTYVFSPGTYMLAISRFNRDAANSAGLLIWHDVPYYVERQPDGPASFTDDITVAQWVNTVALPAGDYTITLTGAAFLSDTCPADHDGDGFVSGLDFDAYVSDFELGDARADVDRDGFVTGLDFDAYVVAFEAGC